MAFSVKTAVDKATSELLLMPDWDTNLQVCDYASAGAAAASEAFARIARKMQSKNPKVALLALTLADSCIKNGSVAVMRAAAERDFQSALVALAENGGRTHGSDVQQAAAGIVQLLGMAFPADVDGSSGAALPFKSTLDALRSRGVSFPEADHSAISALKPSPVPAAAPAPAAAGAAAAPVAPSPVQSRARGGSGAAAAAAPVPSAAALPPHEVAAALSGALTKLRSDLHAVRQRVAAAARLLVEGGPGAALPAAAYSALCLASPSSSSSSYASGSAAPAPPSGPAVSGPLALIDTLDMLAQAQPRLNALVEACIAGVIGDEGAFDACLSVSEGVARVLEAGGPLLACYVQAEGAAAAVMARREGVEAAAAAFAAVAATFAPTAHPQLADLVDFDAVDAPAAGGHGHGSGSGSVDPFASSSGLGHLGLPGGAAAAAAPAAAAALPASLGGFGLAAARPAPSGSAAEDDLLSLFAGGGGGGGAAAAAPAAAAPTASAHAPAVHPVLAPAGSVSLSSFEPASSVPSAAAAAGVALAPSPPSADAHAAATAAASNPFDSLDEPSQPQPRPQSLSLSRAGPAPPSGALSPSHGDPFSALGGSSSGSGAGGGGAAAAPSAAGGSGTGSASAAAADPFAALGAAAAASPPTHNEKRGASASIGGHAAPAVAAAPAAAADDSSTVLDDLDALLEMK